MSKNSPLLSFCIPTYKNPDSVDKILSQIKKSYSPDIEIIIWDDSPDNKTKNIVESYQPNLPVKYFKGKKKGLDPVIISLTREAKGNYVWWFGDDELLPGGLVKVLETLRSKKTSFLWANYKLMNYALSKEEDSGVDIEKEKYFKNKNEALVKLGGRLGFITATILKRSLVITGIDDSKKYLGTQFVNLYLVLHVLSQSNSAYFIKDYIFKNLPNKPEEVNDDGFEVFGVHFLNIVNGFKSRFDNRSVRRLLSKNFSGVWRSVLVRWVTGYESPKGKKWIMFKKYWSYPGFWLALLFLLLPLSVNKFLYKVYKKFFSFRQLKFLNKND